MLHFATTLASRLCLALLMAGVWMGGGTMRVFDEFPKVRD